MTTRVLAVASYPELAASTRYRLLQFLPFLPDHGVSLDFRPFLSSRAFSTLYDRKKMMRTAAGLTSGVVRRVFDLSRLGSYDAVFVQREAALIGPPVFESRARRRLPMVLDLDDATYLNPPSEVYGRFASLLKEKGKADSLIRWADHVLCGSPSIAEYVRGYGIPATVVPAVVDVDRFTPRAVDLHTRELVIGWIGTHSTLPYLTTLLPVLRRLASSHQFRIKVIGAGTAGGRQFEGLDVEMVPWRLDREVSDLHTLDIALYPITSGPWGEGKSGLKATQYLSCGIPYVASPVGVVKQIGVVGETHFEAVTHDEWHDALSRLLLRADLRARMSLRARQYAVEHYSIRRTAETIASVLHSVVEKRRRLEPAPLVFA